MKVVLDTNVVVSALLNPNGVPAQIQNLLLTDRLELLYDNRVLDEYWTVLKREKFGFSKESVDDFLRFIMFNCEFVISSPAKIKFPDEEDRKFYEVFKSGKAKYLITGNKRHYPRDAGIVSPREFIERSNLP